MRPRLVVAALSARMLAESARGAGFDVLALDVFGDRDTRAATTQWQSIASGGAPRIDAARLAAALRSIEGRDGIVGWIAGAGCEPHLAPACAAAPRLPLIGNPPEVVAAVRDPLRFFGALRELGIAFPDTRHAAPADTVGWLVKDFAGSGGWHIHDAASHRAAAPSPTRYWQRSHAGQPLSALFAGNGREARVLGLQRQLVRPVAGRPHVFCGVVGPVDPGAQVRRDIGRIIERLVARFALRGLGSVDGLLDGDEFVVLEVNPRPTASIALYDDAGSMLRAHLSACRGAALPDAPAVPDVRGIEIVFAERVVEREVAARPWCHDLPAAPRVERGDPICSVSARGATEHAVREQLARHRHAVLSSLESPA